MVRVIGAPRRPQALFSGFSEDDPAYQEMAALVAHAAILKTSPQEWLSSVRPEEWDVFVSRGDEASVSWVPPWMNILSLNGSSTSVLASEFLNGSGAGSAIGYKLTGRQPSPVIHVHSENVPESLARLVSTELVPWLNGLDRRPFWVQYERYSAEPMNLRVNGDYRLIGAPWVEDADGNIVAGMFARAAVPRRTPSGAYSLTVPHMPARPVLWLAGALDLWASSDTEGRFADLATWRDSVQYQSGPERQALAALESHDQAHEESVRAYEARRIELLADVEAARIEADRGLRQLLTAQDDPLVSAAIGALTSLGFQVRDMDAEVPQGVAKMEDLRLQDPSETSWTNITEVKGHGKGAKTSVFQDIARFATAYVLQEGRVPDSRWYVVNQYRADPPQGRPDLLPGAASDLASFAQDGGLVIDTRSLFALVRMVEEGDLSAADARLSLRSATGIYSEPPRVVRADEGEASRRPDSQTRG